MPKPVGKDDPEHSWARTLAALIGSVPIALSLAIALTFGLPLPLSERYLIGMYSVFPLWSASACWVFLASSGKRAWLGLGAVFLLAVAVSAVAALLGRGVPGSEALS